MVEPSVTTEGFDESNKNLLVSKQLVNPNDPELKIVIQKYIDQIDSQIANGSENIVLRSDNNDRIVEMNKREIELLIKRNVDQASHLINAILKEQKIDINDLTVAYFCSMSFKSLICQMLKKNFLHANSNLFYAESELSVLNGIGIVVKNLFQSSFFLL